MGLLLFWFFASLVVAVWASNRGRSGFAWWLLSMLLSPLLGALFLAVQPNLAAQRRAGADPYDDAARVRCPACAECVHPLAVRCKHCQGELVPQPMAAAVNPRPAEGLEADPQNVLLVGGFLLAVVLVVLWVAYRFG